MVGATKDKNSLEWSDIKDYCLKRQAELREENDGDLDVVETSRLRGMIELTKEILSLDKKEQVIEIENTTYIE